MRRYFYFLVFVLFLIHCGKEHEPRPQQNDMSFQYNGQTYSGNTIGYPILDNSYVFRGIEIRGSVLPGFLTYSIFSSDCAYLVPQGLFYSLGADCRPEPMNPADSSKVYFYRAGSLNYSFYDCEHKEGYLPGPGPAGRVEYDECVVSGTFSLTLANKNNEVIEIKNGSFTFYPVRK